MKFPYREYGVDDYIFHVTKNPEHSKNELMDVYFTKLAAQQTRFDQDEIELAYDAPLPKLYPSRIVPRAGNVTIDHAAVGHVPRPPLHLNGWDFIPQADPVWHPNGSYKAVRYLGGTRTPPELLPPPHLRAHEGVCPVERWNLPDPERPTWRLFVPWAGDHLLPPVEPSQESARLSSEEAAQHAAARRPIEPAEVAAARSASGERRQAQRARAQ